MKTSLGLVLVVCFAPACTSILDTDSLNSETKRDKGVTDGPGDGPVGDGDQFVVVPDILPGDLGSCVPGGSCAVPGAKGLCAVGKVLCFEAGTGICQQTVNPAAEVCGDSKDSDCDGLADGSDPDAHQACKTKYPNRADKCRGADCGCGTHSVCPTGETCVSGTCKCGTGDHCSLGHTCVNGTCLCGTKPKCTQPNPRCSAGSCICAGTQVCEAYQTCNISLGKCEGSPPDLGVDQAVPDKGVPDLPKPDLPKPDVGVDQGEDS